MKKKILFLLISITSILISSTGCELPNLSNDALGGSENAAKLVAYYPFNGNADDESGKGTDGYAVGAALVNDRFGNASSAYQFYSSQDSRIQIMGSKSVKFGSGDFSINLWYYDLGTTVYPGALFLHTDLSDGWGLVTLPDPGFVNVEEYFLMVEVSDTEVLNTWRNMCVVRKDDVFSLYVNKVKIDEAAWSASMKNYIVSVIGAGFNGMVDDVRIYKNALTQSEIDGLYHEGGWDSDPEINIKQGSSDIASGTGSHDFGSFDVDASSSEVSFTIENSGIEDLDISSVTSSESQFTVDTAYMDSTVLPAGTTTFTVTFSPTSPGSKSSTITVNSNDSDEGTYTFTVTGTAVSTAEINVKQGSSDLASGSGSYDFGSCDISTSSSAVSFTVENTGVGDLNISSVTSDDSQFTVNTSSMDSVVAASDTTSFTVTFSPSSDGSKSATITVSSDDYDEGSYTFTVNGTGTSAPEINIKQGSSNIAYGSGYYYFGEYDVGASSSAVSFTVENSGNGSLNISSVVSNDSEFAVDTSSMSSTVTPGGTTSFTVTFSPSSAGGKNATITVSNNDSNEGSYSFTVLGLTTVTSGLVAYYPFNGNAVDESPNSHNGTVYGATLTADRFGESSKAYDFDGTDDYIDLGNSFESTAVNISYAAWIKTTYDVPTNQAGVIISHKENMYTDSCVTLLLNANNYAAVGLNSHQHYTTWPEYDTAINDGNWHFVVATKSGSTLTIYVDGNVGGTFNDGLAVSSTSKFFIGYDKVWYDVVGHSHFDGVIDDVRIYNRALTTAEISALYHVGGWDLD